MQQRIRILIVEDNPTDAELMVRKLRLSGFELDWQRVDTEADYIANLDANPQLILSDFELPGFSGLRALELLKQRPSLDIPFIIVSGAIGEDIGVAAMREGATDYLLKDRIARLGPAVRRALQEVSERGDRKRLEAQFIEVQKMEVVGQLACGTAHNFNNALSVVMGYSELLLGSLGINRSERLQVEQIQYAAEQAAGIARQLLLVSRRQQVQSVELNINEVVNSMEEMLREWVEQNIEMTISYGDNVGLIKADPSYVWQMLMNLVINARDAMPNGGRLAIETSEVCLDDAYAQEHPGATPGAYVLLSVTDTGTGMTEEVKARLFETFFTTKPLGKGTGLGLATCQTAVRQSGGHIDVSSRLGEGTTFKIYFPAMRQSPLANVGFELKTTILNDGAETILLVEDEPAIRRLVQKVLITEGYNVLIASNGQEAIRVANEYRGNPISLLLSDLNMPQMDGKGMAERLRTKSPEMKILFTSGFASDEFMESEALQTGAKFLLKPFTTSILVRNVRQMLGASQ